MGRRAQREPDPQPPPRWAAVQESIARLAGVSLASFDPRGKVIAAAATPEICRLVAGSPEGARRCAEWCGRHRAAATTEDRTLFFRCHAGLRCFAAPLRAGVLPAGALLGGRAIERAADVDQAAESARTLGLALEDVQRAVGGLALVTPRLLERAADLAARAAAAVFSCHESLAAERSRSALLTSLLALGAEFAREREPHEVHSMILDATAVLLDVRGACLLVRDARTGRFRLRTSFGVPAALVPAAGLPEEHPLVAQALRERAPAAVAERGLVAGQWPFPGAGSLTVFPLLAGDRALGLLCVLDTPLDDGAAELLAAFCHQAALALSNALLREQLARRTREVERADRVRARLSGLLTWDGVLEAVFEEAVLLAGAREASLMLLDPSARTLRVSRARGEHSAVLRAVSVPAGEGIAGRVASENRPLLVEDLERDGRLRHERRPRYRTGSFLVVPLTVRGRVIGVINLADKEADAAFGDEDLEAVLAVTAQAGWALQSSALAGRVRALREQAATDPLTGLANRRQLESRLREEAARALRHGSPFTLTMIDLDGFKAYNDREGHPAGDRLLAAVARAIRAASRESDVVARYGGDEIAVISPETHLEQGLALAERVRLAVASHAFGLPGLPPAGGVTLSAGVACFPADTDDAAALVRAADAALYRAKAAGRNRVARNEA